MLRSIPLLGLTLLLAIGCDGEPDPTDDSGTSDSGTSDSGSGDAGPGDTDSGAFDAGGPSPDTGTDIAIPDPGTSEPADWGSSVFPGMPCCQTPMSAYPVGVVTTNPGYVQGDIDMSVGEFFYVFRTGPAFTEFIWPGGAPTEEVHLHEGTGLILGPHVTPSASTATTGTWTVLPDAIYVLHLVSSSGGFF